MPLNDDWPDIAEHPIDEAVYELVSRAKHHEPGWERLTFRHRDTGQRVYRRRHRVGDRYLG